ncbi:MAG: hypothetical protein BRD23_02305 [Halobacteriales archaeon SW_9_67_25]|nr:MAG: hypothetical protein BRD23_02305 [Halobacteriales archaeon SW_9_67_25]
MASSTVSVPAATRSLVDSIVSTVSSVCPSMARISSMRVLVEVAAGRAHVVREGLHVRDYLIEGLERRVDALADRLHRVVLALWVDPAGQVTVGGVAEYLPVLAGFPL